MQGISKPSGCDTFGDFADVFVSSVHSHLSQHCNRVDVAFDHYKVISIKEGARVKRGSSQLRPIRRKVEHRSVPLPQQWKTFIHLPENKSDLTDFLS